MAMPMINSILSDLNITHTQNLAIWATFYVSIIVSSILGTFLSNKVGRLKFLYIWTVLGVVISFLPALLTNVTLLQVWSMSLLLGASFGLGMPSCLAYFADCTVVENRGRIGGITFLIANISVPLLAILFSSFDLATFSVIFALLRGMGLIVFFLKPEKQPSSQVTKSVSFVSILRDKPFLLYFVAWFMFPLVDQFERVIIDQFLTGWTHNLLPIMGVVEPLVAGFSILIAGLLCDWIGRKKIVLFGFVALGVAYAIIGLVSDSVFLWYLYFLVDGVAWGIFLLIFVLILWGDLAQSGSSEKHYALGSIPFFLSSVIPLLLTQSFIEQVSLSAAFSLASFFLFVAVMPLVFAPETLPEKKMELRRL
ncbi:MFS transporter, partial [Candidatus Bathyarchaeota archaeon]|nr:MFS transporter [Candidatus Bathyarchaeota archaeon]